MMMKIGIYGGGFKPLTSGHFQIIEKASKENDIVKVFVSTGDRTRKGEHPIFWKDMEHVWKIIEKVLPENVYVYYVPAPIKPIIQSVVDVASHLDHADDSKETLTVYADPDSMDNIFYPKRLQKFKSLIDSKRLNLVKLSRGIDTANVSGTMLRRFLQLGLKSEFIKALPKPLRSQGDTIFSILNGFED